jgi:hypothetical protein
VRLRFGVVVGMLLLAVVPGPSIGEGAGSTCSFGQGVVQVSSNALLDGTVGAEDRCLFEVIPYTQGGDSFRVELRPGAPGQDISLRTRWGTPPTIEQYDCQESGALALISCRSPHQGTPLYIEVRVLGGGAFRLFQAAYHTCLPEGKWTAWPAGRSYQFALNGDAWAECNHFHSPDLTRVDVGRFELRIGDGLVVEWLGRLNGPPTDQAYDCRFLLGPGESATCGDFHMVKGTTFHSIIRRVAGEGAYTTVDRSHPSCSLGLGTHLLPRAVPTQGAVTVHPWARCKFVHWGGGVAEDSVSFELQGAGPGSASALFATNRAPTFGDHDCRVQEDPCDFPLPASFFAEVSKPGGGVFTMTARPFNTCSLGKHDVTLPNVTAVEASMTHHGWAACRFKFLPAPGGDFVEWTLEEAGVEATLDVRKGWPVQAGVSDCRALPVEGTERCSLVREDDQPYYGLVRRTAASGAFRVASADLFLPQLHLGTISEGDLDVDGWSYWKLIAPGGLGTLTFAAAAKDGADLYVRHISDLRAPRGWPLPNLAMCTSAGPSPLETCTISPWGYEVGALPAPTALVPHPHVPSGKYFIGVHGAPGAPFRAAAAAAPDHPALETLRRII